MSRARTATKPQPAKTTIHDSGVDPLASFLADRPGWSKNDLGGWQHTDRKITVTVGAPGSVSRFGCMIGESKPVTFATRTGVECWITAAGA